MADLDKFFAERRGEATPAAEEAPAPAPAEEKPAEAVEAKLRQQLQAAMGSATSAVFQGGGKISWKKSKDRLAPDLERLSLDHPGLLQQYSKPVAGSRRFVVQAGRGRS